MSPHKLAYARVAYKSFSRSARHLLLLIATHQSIETGWAYLSYLCLSEELGVTRRRVIQLVALLEAKGVLDVRRGQGRGHVNFYRILREEDGLPVPHRSTKKVKSQTPPPAEKVKFPHSIGFSGRQRSLDCQRRLPRYFPCAPSSQLRNLSENKLNNISSLKVYH
jgi:hypothetical protein